MLRQRFFSLVLVVIAAITITIIVLPVMAAPPAQEVNPPERLRPDQYSYHGVEEMPFLGVTTEPQEGENTNSTPNAGPSRMATEHYYNGIWDIFVYNDVFNFLFRVTDNGDIVDIHPRLKRGTTRIAFSSDQGPSFEILSANLDGSDVIQLTNNQYDDVKPAWSPDGNKIAFQSYRDGNAEVYVMNADGSGQANLTQNGDYDGEPTWSPDGTRIAFTSRRTGGYRIWVMNADGSNPVQLSNQMYSENPGWSPDGGRIGYDADNDNNGWQDLWSMNANGSSQVIRKASPGDFHYFANGWSPDAINQAFTALHLIYYYGNWYWDYADLMYISQDGSVQYIKYHGTDWNVDWTTMDILPPTTRMGQLSSAPPYQFEVSWSGQDDLAGILNYDIQVREGAAGTWTDWHMGTTGTSATFTGIGEHEYFFRSRARDKAHNVGSWPSDYQASAQVESVAPLTSVNPIVEFTRGDAVTITWGGQDFGGSGIKNYDLQVMD